MLYVMRHVCVCEGFGYLKICYLFPSLSLLSPSVPPPPSLVSVTVTSSTSVSITAESGIDAPIALHVRINGSVQVFNNPLQPSVVSGLTPETTYQVEVAVQSFDGIGRYSQPIIINTHNNNGLCFHFNVRIRTFVPTVHVYKHTYLHTYCTYLRIHTEPMYACMYIGIHIYYVRTYVIY